MEATSATCSPPSRSNARGSAATTSPWSRRRRPRSWRRRCARPRNRRTSCSRTGHPTTGSEDGAKYRDGVRVGLVCPYSLTVPGGVQGQVLGLARALRTLGHDVRVLAPSDGPPPDAGVTPLGKSIPMSSNGSWAPIAPDPSCALRTIRALRDEAFDVVHLHEPFCPGPTLTSMLFTD